MRNKVFLTLTLLLSTILYAQTWDFNSSTNTPSDLTVSNGGVVGNGNGTGSNGYFNFGSNYLDFRGTGTRYVQFPAVNTSGGSSTLAFDLINGNTQNGGEMMDSGESVLLKYSTDSGSSWTTHTTYDQSTYKQSSPVAVSLNLTGNLAASSIIFRLEQASHSGTSFDHWGVDDIVLNTVDNTAPTILATSVAADNSTISVTFSEAVYTATGANTALVVGDFALSLSGGQATLSSATPSSIAASSNTYTLGLPISGTPNGSEVITVVPANSTAIYDAADNAASTTQSNNTVNLNDKTVAGTPTGLTAVAFYGGAQLNWDAVSNASKYYVYYSTNDTTYTKYTTTEPTVDSLDISNLTKGTSYYYKVTSIKSNGTESNKSTATGATLALRGLYVTTGGSDSNNGYSESKGLATLSEAVTDAATGDTIYVKAGTYTFSSSSDGNISIDGSKNLVIKGDGSGTTIIDAAQKHRHFYFSSSSNRTVLDTTFKIMDMTLKNGRPSSTDNGGSVYMTGHWDGSKNIGHEPLFQNVVFESNQTKWTTSSYWFRGGAVRGESAGAPYFRDVTFKYNFSDYAGGAVYLNSIDTTKTINFERTTFIGNYVKNTANEYQKRGGAVYLSHYGKAVFENTIFDSNYVAINGDCCTNEGGAIFSENNYDSLIVRNSKFRYNKVYKPSGSNGGEAEGGAIYQSNGYDQFLIENSLFEGNTAEAGYRTWTGGGSDQSARAGAIRIDINRFSSGNNYIFPWKTVMSNNTFVNNKAQGSGSNDGRGGALLFEWAQNVILFNNIFYGNRGNNFGSDSLRHHINGYDDSNSEIYMGYNNFDKGLDNANSYGSDNINRDPQFVLDGSDDQYALSDASFLIGAGIKTFESRTAPTKDILGNTRPSGSSTDNPDMGAYENALAKTTYPDKVAGVTGTSANKSAVLSWTANSESNISKYAVYQSTTNNFTPASSDSVGESTTNSYTATGLTNKTAYYFRVRAINSSNQAGEFSDQVTVTPEYKGVGGWHVAVADSGGTATGEGSVASPMLYLSDAVTASASGDTIILGGGTHSYTSSSRLNISFDGSKNLVIKGAGKDKTIIDANQKHRHFYFSANSGGTLLDTTFKIMDMTLKNGRPSSVDHGGSVYLYGYWDGSNNKGHGPLFQNVIFESNQTKWSTNDWNKRGGAVYAYYSHPSFRDVTFKNNLTDYQGGAVSIRNADTTKTIIFERTNFTKNKAAQEKDVRYSQGGAVYLSNTGKVIFESSVFDSNYVEMNGECCNNYGGAITSWNNYDSLIVRNSKFRYNKVYKPTGNNGGQAHGGAIYYNDGNDQVLIENSLFLGNTAEAGYRTWTGGGDDNSAYGGAIYLDVENISKNNTYLYPWSSVWTNNTFVNNKALGSGSDRGRGGAIYLEWGNKAIFFNNLFYGNRVNNPNDSDSLRSHIIHGYSDGNSEIYIGHNNFDKGVDNANSYGSDNINRDPQFVLDGSDDQYALSDASFLIGAGVKTFESRTAPTKDILGNTRPSGSSTDNPDIGAYENALAKTTYPDKVAGVTGTSGNKSAVLSWTANSESNISKYAVYQSTTSGFTPASSDSVGESTTTSYTATGLTNKTAYYFRVKAINSSNQAGEFSDQVTVTPEYKGVGGWHVAVADSGGTSTGEGSVSNPMLYLSDAVTASASGDTIILGGGTHSYTSSSRLNISFDGSKSSLVIKGAGKDKTIIDANQKHRHFRFYGQSGNIDTTFKIMDMTLKNGRPSSIDRGGSVWLAGWDTGNNNYTNRPEPMFINVAFENNQTRYTADDNWYEGGAIYIAEGAAPQFRDVTFRNNHSAGRGGAVRIGELPPNTTVTFERTEFISNYGIDVSSQGTDVRGGAISLTRIEGTINFNYCLFDSNRIEMNGGWSYYGGAIYGDGDRPTFGTINIANSRFLNNRVYKPDGKDGGDANGGAILFSNFSVNLYITSSLFYNNYVEAANSTDNNGNVNTHNSHGGALNIGIQNLWDGSTYQYPGETRLINNTFVENKSLTVTGNSSRAGTGGAIFLEWGQKVTMFNNIFYNNEATNRTSSDGNYEVYGLNRSDMVLEIGYNSSYYEKTAEEFNNYGGNNIWKDPKFLLDGGADQFQLTDASRLIGAGALTYAGVKAPATDILGNARPTTDPDRPDLGAYENANINPPYPDKVVGLVADAAHQSVILSWTENIEADLNKYAIYQSETSGFTPTTADSIGEVAAGTNSYTSTGLTNRTYYYYKVRAYNTQGNAGEFSDEVSAYPEYEGPVWWVAIDGNNSNDGNEANPLGTVDHAVGMAFDGDTIKIKPGTYEDSQTSTNDGKSLTIIGVDGFQNTIIDNKGSYHHFNLWRGSNPNSNPITITIEGLSLVNGGGGQGGSIYSENLDSLFIVDSYFQNNHSNSYGGAILMTGEVGNMFISNSSFLENESQDIGGAVFSYIGNGNEGNSTLSINNSVFELNRAWGDGGGAVFSGVNTNIKNSLFKENSTEIIKSGSANGGALVIMGNTNIEAIISGSIFYENLITGNGNQNGNGAAIYFSGTSLSRIENNVFSKNKHFMPTGGDGTVMTFGGNNHSRILAINNTFYDNHRFNGSSGDEISFHSLGDAGADIRIFNNVLYSDGNQLPDQSGDGSAVKKSNNIFKAISNVEASKDFRNHQGLDFSLKPTSDLIDGGIQFHHDGNSAADVYAPIKDLRGYYRIGLPDVGAYEFGASKYLLDITDNIAGDLDTTFVKLGDSIKFTITTNDISGNQVQSNEPVNWKIYPNDKYISLLSGDTTTSGGDAEATFEVSSLDKSKGFRFRIRADVGDAVLGSKLYIIEEIVTGAPPAVANLKVTTEDWTNNSEFTLTWENPAWDRDLIGINMLLVDDIGETQSRFEPFPDGGVLTSFTDNLIESGIYTVYLWLVDELGNENPATRDSVTLKFDNMPPNPFFTHTPSSDEWAPPQPTFYFDDAGDYPSGVEEYLLFINDNVFQTYGGVNTSGDDGYVDIDNPLNDGYYNWYMETRDYAGNVTRSDTAYFGVDTQPPTITHSSPLSIIDEGVDSPAIKASFFDAASGVYMARLFYRTAGSGGSWKSNDLISGSTYVQASDVNPSGIEYYIESSDNLGNYSKWPETEPYQSVKVRSATNITSATRWSNGIPGGTDVTNYQLFSIPFDVGNAKSAITSVMGPADKFKYRLYKYGGGEEPWQEDPSSLTMGEAYFFIFDPAEYEVDGAPTKITFDFGQGTSTPTNPPYEKSISSSDWTLFGSPYNFNLILSNVYAEDGTSIRDAGTLYGFSNGSWRSVSSIEPWQGYAFKSAGATKLIFDGRGGFSIAAKELDYENIPMDHNEWVIDISASTGTTRDDLNAVGVRNMAENGYDPFDEFEPPTLPGDVVLRIDNRDWDNLPDLYAKDIRKPNKTGHFWDIEVFAPTNGQRTYLAFDGLGYVPEEYDIFLVNKTTKQAKNLEWESGYQFANTGSEDYLKQEFRLVIGTKEFVQDNNAGVNLYPDAFSLAQNYPNPFNPQTSIMISLEEDANVDLVIYNLLGEEITRLAANEYRPAGYYNFIWNGRNAIGDKVSTGVYFYHAMIRNDQGRVVLNKTKKMIFLK